MTRAHSPWVVLKFGGTSVSTLPNWKNIASIVKKRSATGAPVLVVHSAVTKVTDMLEKLLEAALQQKHEDALAVIEKRHRDLAAELGIGVSPELEKYFSELRQIAAGVALVGEVSDKTRARLMSNGELMATEMGGRFLASQGINVKWADARTMLKAEERKGASAKASLLSATCNFAPDEAMQKRLTDLAPVVITQGFIASDEDGNTVLLGRGGSDTSAAYLAAKLNASRLEIWTDVPGMFSANPRSTPTARMLKALHYDEAQEIASNGAKVLHPRCILPARQHDIPLYVLATQTPDLEGTLVTSAGADGAAQVKAVAIKKGITLVSMESPGMWHQVGFVADAFQVFKAHGMSVDLISTSETNVTVSLDPQANSLDRHLLDALVADLTKLCRVEVLGPCASVSLLGRNIRAILHKLGDALELFAEQKIYLVSQAANDLNFTFVVDEDQGDRLVEQLHEMLIRPVPGDRVLGPTWEQLFAKPESAAAGVAKPWWHGKRDQLVGLLKDKHSAYVYDVASVVAAARAVRGIKSVSRVHYAMKANPHPDLLRALYAEGVHPECVSRGEVERVYSAIPNIDRKHILFTPNFAPRDEYVWAFEQGVQVTVDNAYVVEKWPDVFKGREIFVRVDTGTGRGHHSHVRTAGTHSKFGVPLAEMPALAKSVQKAGAKVVGLHAHTGSGVFDVRNWEETATLLTGLIEQFPNVRVVDVGGGLGVPERAEQPGLDLAKLDAALAKVKAAFPRIELWMEPGRYFVAAAGVLIARVTQLKSKGSARYVGIATGMNSLIRPALYGAYHEIVNLSRLDEAGTELTEIVGPICESGDILGHDRLLPPTQEGDVLLVANAGAYGRAMSSTYNLRDPAVEICI